MSSSMQLCTLIVDIAGLVSEEPAVAAEQAIMGMLAPCGFVALMAVEAAARR